MWVAALDEAVRKRVVAAEAAAVGLVVAVWMPEGKHDLDENERNESGSETWIGTWYPLDPPMPHANRRAGNKKRKKEEEEEERV